MNNDERDDLQKILQHYHAHTATTTDSVKFVWEPEVIGYDVDKTRKMRYALKKIKEVLTNVD